MVADPGYLLANSCASPVFSAVMSLINDVRLQNGKAPLGFLNPWIYQVLSSRSLIHSDRRGRMCGNRRSLS